MTKYNSISDVKTLNDAKAAMEELGNDLHHADGFPTNDGSQTSLAIVVARIDLLADHIQVVIDNAHTNELITDLTRSSLLEWLNDIRDGASDKVYMYENLPQR